MCVWNWLMFLLVEIPVSPSMFVDQLILFFLFEPLKVAKMIESIFGLEFFFVGFCAVFYCLFFFF